MDNFVLEQALYLLEEKRWSVIPVGRDKKPLIEWKKFQTEKVRKEEVIGWFNKYQHINLGVVTGKISGIIVIDIDPRHGGTDEQFKELITVKAQTGGGGWHYYFQYAEGIENKAGIKEGIDIRGEGGFVVVPPSETQAGQYKWLISPKEGQVLPLPDFIKKWINEGKTNQVGTESNWNNQNVNGVNEGKRNETAASVTGKLLKRFPEKEWNSLVLPFLRAWNNQNNPPLSDNELLAVFNSIAERERKNRTGGTETLPVVNIDTFPVVTLKEALAAVEKVLPGKGDLLLIALATCISHLVDHKTPLWMMFVGVPSSAKTEIVRMLQLVSSVFFLDSLTENAFISGSRNRDGASPADLLPLLDGKCFVVKDFTTTFSQKEETIKKILGDLTSIYDDSFSKHSPARGTVRYHAFFSILACVTPSALNHHQRYMNQIGPRFLFYRVPGSNTEQVDKGFDIIWSTDDAKSCFEEVQKIVSAFCHQLIKRIDGITLEKENDEIIHYLDDLAIFIARVRGMVLTRNAEFTNTANEKISFYEPVEIQIEEPYRALLQLRVLARSLAIVNGGQTIEAEELKLVKEVAFSSMPADRSLLLSVITSEDKSWSAKEVADKLGISHKTALRQLDELISLKVLEKMIQGEGLANLYSVNSQFRDLFYNRVEFMSHPLVVTGTQTPPQVSEPSLSGTNVTEELSDVYKLEIEQKTVAALTELTAKKGFVRGDEISQMVGCPYTWVKETLEVLKKQGRVLSYGGNQDLWAVPLEVRKNLESSNNQESDNEAVRSKLLE